VRERLAAWEAEASNPRSGFADIAPGIVDALQRELTFEQEAPSVPVDTSEAAARKVEGKSAYWRAEIYALIKGCGALGATEREIEHALHLSGNTVRPRLWELEGNAPAGRPPRVATIYKSPEKRDGARVYRIVER